MKRMDAPARERLLRAALKHFAERGYAGTSVQEIVDDADVTKPTLYYYFANKAGLYHALIDLAYDERLRLMQEAASQSQTLASQLTAIILGQFEFARKNRELMRIGFATMFAAPREVPNPAHCLTRARRNFNFLLHLVRQAQERGEISASLDVTETTLAAYGMMAIHVLSHLANPQHPLTRQQAEFITQVFLHGIHGQTTPAPAAPPKALKRKRIPARPR